MDRLGLGIGSVFEFGFGFWGMFWSVLFRSTSSVQHYITK